MSIENVQQFTVFAFSNPALTEKIQSAVAGKSPSDAADAFTALGQSEGYEFSSAEALQVREGVISQKLSEADLDRVAGGGGSDPFAEMGATYAFGQLFGRIVPFGGNVIGAGLGAAAGSAAGGGSASDATASGAMAGASALDDLKSGVGDAVQAVGDFFSSW